MRGTAQFLAYSLTGLIIGAIAPGIATVLVLLMAGTSWTWSIGLGSYLGMLAAIPGGIIGLFVGIVRFNRGPNAENSN
jgi:hypothetical protein